MLSSKYDNEFKEESRFGKKILIWTTMFIIAVSVIAFAMNRSVQIVDNGIVHYEEFQEIYNTCQKINADLETIRNVADSDKMFDQFSKQSLIANKRQQMTRWVEEYNAKSKMINRSIWKSGKLPYQLSVEDFPSYSK